MVYRVSCLGRERKGLEIENCAKCELVRAENEMEYFFLAL